MSGPGIGGTIFSMFCGFGFIAFGIFLILNGSRFRAVGVPKELCIALSILIIVYGGIMVLVGKDQIEGIKEGKEYPEPGTSIWP